MKLFFPAVLLSALATTMQAETVGQAKQGGAIVQQYLDSLSACRNIESAEQLSAYNHYKLFAPATFYHSVSSSAFALNDISGGVESKETDAALLNIYMNRPALVTGSEKQLKDAASVKEEICEPIKNEVELVQKVAPRPQEVVDAPVVVVVEKPNFWTIKGDYYVQFLQNFVSANWYKGGESNYAMVASGTLEANYDNKEKLKWGNKLEAKLGFQTSRADSIHNLKTSEDLLRLTSKLGLQASKHWYYTLNLLAYTQFMRGYKNNDLFTYSDFMSPFTLNISLGMNYGVEWLNKRLTGNIQISPLAYNLKFVDRLALSTRNGIKEGKHTLNDFGSMFTADLMWKFNDNISWKTRLYGFTSYKRAEIEWENEFTFQFNKYISSKLFIYPRFDDNTQRDSEYGYWQLREYASLGFSYSF
ncbi:MAG: DUF3078 domain-containing protein [Prevotella sp.]|nr:DUF3078 domain-containing protein [Prevotella sp.]